MAKKETGAARAPSKSRVLADARAAATKVLKSDQFRVILDPDQMRESLPHIPTGSMVIDYLIGGEPNRHGVPPCPGLPRGKITQLWGLESSGKTTLALTAAASVARQGGTVLYLDWEQEIVPDYAAALGVPIHDPDQFELVQPETLEDGIKLIKAYALAGVDLIVIDSVGAGVPATVAERKLEEAGEQTRLGLAAQKWGEFLPELKGIINRHHNAVLGISQVRSKIATGPGARNGPQTEPQGGFAWRFYSALRIELRRAEQEKSKAVNQLTHRSEDRVYGAITWATIKKCKLSKSQGRQERFFIRWGEGIDDIRSLIEIALGHDVLRKSGAWIQWGEQKWQGTEAIRKALKADPEMLGRLMGAVRPHLSSQTTDETDDSEELDGSEESDLAAFVDGETGETAPAAPEE